MDKRRAIQIMTKAAQLYKENLEDQKVLFLYGLPREVKKQLQEKGKILSSVQGYEVCKRWLYRAEIGYIGANDAD